MKFLSRYNEDTKTATLKSGKEREKGDNTARNKTMATIVQFTTSNKTSIRCFFD